MIPIHDVVGEIQELLYADVEWDVGRLQQLAKAYADACSRMMVRAQNCRELFDQGFKKEAYDAARKDPDLEELLALLDFDNRAAWLDMCERAELPTPGDFDGAPVRDLLDQLNQGSNNVDRLLRVYCRMSVGLAPLTERLTVLRRLRREDYREICWDEDIRIFERAAVDDLVQRARAGDLAGDLPALDSVLAQLLSDEWMEKPLTQAKAVERLILPHRVAFVRTRYADLLEPLQKAFDRKDEQACRGLAARWNELESASGVRPAAPAAAAMIPIREWLAEQERLGEAEKARKEACARLEAALARGADLKALDALATKAQSFGLDLPEPLATRVASRMRELRRSARQKYVLRLATIITLAAVACVTIVVVNAELGKKQSISAWQERIGAMLDKEELEAAGKLLNAVAAERRGVYASAEIQDVQARYAKMLKDDQIRRENFKRAVDAAAASIGGLPDMISIKRAEILARTPEEKQQALVCSEKIRRRNDELRKGKVAEIDELVAKLETAREQADTAYRATSVAQSEKQTREFDSQAGGCLALAEQIELAAEITPGQRARVEAVKQVVLGFRKSVQGREQQAQAARKALAEIAKLYGNPRALSGELQAFAQEFPEHPLSREFARCAKWLPQWESLDEWKRLASFLTVPEYPVQKRIQAIDDYLKNYPTGVMRRPVAQYKQYFALKEAVFAEGKMKHLAEARDLVNDRFVADIFMVQTRKGYRCYLLRDDQLQTSTLNGVAVRYGVECIIDRTLKRRLIPVNAADLIGLPAPAPQTQFAKAAAELIGKANNQKWETFYLRLAEQAMAVKEMDPILRVTIVKTMLDYAADTTPFEGKAIEQISKTLAEYSTPVNWIDPEDREAELVRPSAATALDEVGSLAPLIAKVEKQLGELTAALTVHRAVGIVTSPEQITLGEIVSSAPLYAVTPSAGIDFVVSRIGEAAHGLVTQDKGVDLRNLCGSPVYVRAK